MKQFRNRVERLSVVGMIASCAMTVACGGDDAVDQPDLGAAGAAGAASDGPMDGTLSIAVCDPDNGNFSTDIDNPYLPFEVGAVHVLEGLEAATDPVRFETTVLDETMEIAGVETRIVEKMVWEDDEYVALEQEYFAQAEDGTVCFYGSLDQEIEDDEVVAEEGFSADDSGVRPGIMMPGAPAVGQRYEMVHGPDGVETGEITHLGEPTQTPAETFDDTLTVLEDGPSIKKYARGIGQIYDDGLELISYE